MPYAYPDPKTGTAQDLLRVVTRAYELDLERRSVRLPEKSEAQRRWVEPPFRALGVFLAWLMELVPADLTVRIHDRLFTALSAPRSYPFDPAAPELLRARELARRVEADSGKAPALLALISHPPVMGDLAHLNFELVRHATLALRGVRGRPCRPRLVAATDPFALDTTAIWEEGVYAGYMGTYHLGVDRLAFGRGHLGPALTPQASWSAMPLRLFRALAGGAEVGLVLAGGVPATGRVLYGVREWVRSARAFVPGGADPAASARRLDADASFARFKAALAGRMALPRGTWRRIDLWLMAVAVGFVPGETVEAAAVAALDCLGVPAESRPALLEGLARGMTRETPHRRRLFRILAGRVARRRPLVLVPVVHRTEPLGVALGEAWSWEWLGPGRVRARRADAPDAAVETATDAFAELFVEENFK